MKPLQTFPRWFFRLAALGALASILLCRSAYGQAAEPIRGMVGVGTWNTQAEFKDIKVTKGTRTLYASDFSKGLRGWKTIRGKWQVVDGALRQSSSEEDTRAVIGDPNWGDYTLRLKARKLGGGEGFLILFALPDENTRSWWNVGGWGNTKHGFQAPATSGAEVPGTVETGRWYDIKVELSGDTIRAYLDNQLIQTATQAPGTHTVAFSTGDAGVSKAVTTWGMGTVGGFDVMRSGLNYMGADQIDVVIIPFSMSDPLTPEGDISAAAKKLIDEGIAAADLAGANKPLIISAGVGGGPDEVDPWYVTSANPKRVNTTRWAQNMIATRKYVGNRAVWFAQPFNEPDWWQEGSAEDLHEIIRILQADPAYANTKLGGAAVLYVDGANFWYDRIKDLGAIGTTHALSGSTEGYINFLNNARGNSFCPELHSLAEAIIGAEYGMGGGIWWLGPELARGSFVKASQGKRLGYAEDRARWTAAAVYRAPNGSVQAFLSGAERQAQPTRYRFVSRDRAVFFNGDGPRREFTLSTGAATDQVVNITWGQDVPPKLAGRYVLVNRHSGKVLGVVGANKQNGAGIQQMAYTRAAHQQWEVAPLVAPAGDKSYFTIRALHSGKSLDDTNWSHEEGSKVQQWGAGEAGAQHWFFDYAGNNCFYIRNRTSTKYLEPAGGSKAAGAAIVQTSRTGTPRQQWRLIPVSAWPIDFVAPRRPTGLKASARPQAVALQWATNRDADLAGYTVFRSTRRGGPYDTIARGVRGSRFLDNEAKERRAYFYVIKAVDRSLNQSAFSAEASATP